MTDTDPREPLGRLVRQVWVNWAREQPDAKASWLAPWEHLTPDEQEVDMRIGEAIAVEATAVERERIATLASEEADRGTKIGLDRISLRAFAQRLKDQS